MLRSWKTISALSLTLAVLAGCAKDQMKDPLARQKYLAAEQANMKDAPLAETPDILPQTYFAAGNLFVSQGQLSKAIEQYRKAIAVNHKFAAAYHRLGRTLSISGRHEEAIEALARAVEIKPGIALLRNDYGYELMHLERWAESEEQLRIATEIDPKFARAYVNLGLVLSRTERFDEALAAFRTVLPETDARYNLGLLYRGQKRYAEAAEEFRRVLKLDPQFPAAQAQLDQLAAQLESSAMQQRQALAQALPTLPTAAPPITPEPIEEPEGTSETVASDVTEFDSRIAQAGVVEESEAGALVEYQEPFTETLEAAVDFDDSASEFEEPQEGVASPVTADLESSKLAELYPVRLPANELAEQLAAELEHEIRIFRNEAVPAIVERPVEVAASTALKFDADWLQRELQAAYNDRDCLAAASAVAEPSAESFPPRLVRDEEPVADTMAGFPAAPTTVVEVVYRGDPLVEYFEPETTDWRADFRSLDALTGIIGNEIACVGATPQSDRIAAGQGDAPVGPPARSADAEPAAGFGSPVQPNER